MHKSGHWSNSPYRASDPVLFVRCSIIIKWCSINWWYYFLSQGADVEASADVGRHEKARLKQLQKIKKQKIQEILNAQNASIEADMVSLCMLFLLDRWLVFYLLLDFGHLVVWCDVSSVFYIAVLIK